MKLSTVSLGLALALIGCGTGEPSEADRQACIDAGYSPGTEAFETCLQERLASQFNRPAGATVDDMRTRAGPRF